MLKALFLDMDETLCDTKGANNQALAKMGEAVAKVFGSSINTAEFTQGYIKGIYREWTATQHEIYSDILANHDEMAFRVQLISDLLAAQQLSLPSDEFAKQLQHQFDEDRIQAFDFYEGIKAFLVEAKKQFTLVVITNGPEFSQLPKLEAVDMQRYVDHIIVGGQEPEQKPAASIFEKAQNLAACDASEVIHVGDSLEADIVGANGAGITSVWIQHQQAASAEVIPSHTISNPSALPALVKQLAS